MIPTSDRNLRGAALSTSQRHFCIEVSSRTVSDRRTADLINQVNQLTLPSPTYVTISDLFFLRGDLQGAELERLAQELLVDPIIETFRIRSPEASTDTLNSRGVIEVGYHPGVTDPVARHLLGRAHSLGITSLEATATGTRYVFQGDLTSRDLERIAREILCNNVIQTFALGALEPAFVPQAEPSSRIERVPVREADDKKLTRISQERVLFLSLAEMQAIRGAFQRLGRDPTDLELETLAQTWSEHCQHKTFKADIHYVCQGGMTRLGLEDETAQPPYRETIPGLLNSYIQAATRRLNRDWVRSAFVDNAGIIDFDTDWELSFKVETHNHPSALEPFGGANTGVGGVIRDVIGVSARPIANTDVLCFGSLDVTHDSLPDGVLHPARIARGVVAGIEDYGNKMGIPTVSGAIIYHPGYTANPLVYCGCVGLAPKGRHRRDPQTGDLCVALGGRTGRDGLHGATFSSAELTHETGQTVGSVVQIGDPITEKGLLEAVIHARDEGLYTAITDCGAGGFSSAVGEMGRQVGVEIELKDVPLKYPGLRPWEIWLSEAQERMVLAVPPDNLPRLQDICAGYDVELTVMGRFTGDGRLHVCYDGHTVADLEMAFLHDGWPRSTLQAEWNPPAFPEPDVAAASDFTRVLLRMLADPDVASKESVIRRYDHEVQGATLVKPLVGAADDGPSDGVVLRPLEVKGWQGLALGCGICPHLGLLDPYAMAWAAVDEAVRNVVCVGADPDRIALLDNFCWGNPALPDRVGGLVRAAQGCHDAAVAFGTPFISGKDSLNNEFVNLEGGKQSIPPTLLISSLGILPDVRQATTMDLKRPGNLLYILGQTQAGLGASLYYRVHGATGNDPPTPVPAAIEMMRSLHRAMSDGLIHACHDLSEGGLAVAAAEMAIAGRLGLDLDLTPLPKGPQVTTDAMALFTESNGRFLVEIDPEDVSAFEDRMHSHPCGCLGRITQEKTLIVRGLGGEPVITAGIEELLRAWQSTELM
jgi:phosphoribosylformylglycinamidine synthase II